MKVIELIAGGDAKIRDVEDITLDYMQEFVGGYIDIVPVEDFTVDEIVMVINDEGALYDNRELNIFATFLYGYEIYGDVILCKENGPDLEGLTEEQISEIKKYSNFLSDIAMYNGGEKI